MRSGDRGSLHARGVASEALFFERAALGLTVLQFSVFSWRRFIKALREAGHLARQFPLRGKMPRFPVGCRPCRRDKEAGTLLAYSPDRSLSLAQAPLNFGVVPSKRIQGKAVAATGFWI